MTGPEWITLSDAIELWIKSVTGNDRRQAVRPNSGGLLYNEIAHDLERLFSEALLSNRFMAKGIEVDAMGRQVTGQREVIPTEYFLHLRGFHPEAIERWPRVPLAESNSKTNLDPIYKDVIFSGEGFRSWLSDTWPTPANPRARAPSRPKYLKHNDPAIMKPFRDYQQSDELKGFKDRREGIRAFAKQFEGLVRSVSKLADELDKIDKKDFQRKTGPRTKSQEKGLRDN